jgi:hypothetical protein
LKSQAAGRATCRFTARERADRLAASWLTRRRDWRSACTPYSEWLSVASPLMTCVRSSPWGDTIEDYPDDTPYPSRLVLGWVGARPLHVVLADNAATREIIVITVYEPDRVRWDAAFKRRRP